MLANIGTLGMSQGDRHEISRKYITLFNQHLDTWDVSKVTDHAFLIVHVLTLTGSWQCRDVTWYHGNSWKVGLSPWDRLNNRRLALLGIPLLASWVGLGSARASHGTTAKAGRLA